MGEITIDDIAQIFCGVVTDEPARTRTMVGNSDAIAASPSIGNYPVAVQARASSASGPLSAFAHTFRLFDSSFRWC